MNDKTEWIIGGLLGTGICVALALFLFGSLASTNGENSTHADDTVTVQVQGENGAEYFCIIAARGSGGGGIWCERADR